jgi:nucleoside-diphosphate-sugar epimerase
MRVFLTGATGYVATAIAEELLGAGHTVLGVARTDEGARALAGRGVEAHRGELADHASLVAGAGACDGVIHTAFIHDFSRFAENAEIETAAVEAMLTALAGSGKPFIATSGVAMLAPDGALATEDDHPPPVMRGATEAVVRAAADTGVRTAIVRLAPSTHGPGDRGFVPHLMDIAREKGVAAYVGEGANRWAGGRRADAARLYRLALENGRPGATYHAIGDEAVPTRDIAAAIGRAVGAPAASVAPEEASAHFGWIGMFFGLEMAASSAKTQAELGWRPTEPGLIADIEGPDYAEASSKYGV